MAVGAGCTAPGATSAQENVATSAVPVAAVVAVTNTRESYTSDNHVEASGIVENAGTATLASVSVTITTISGHGAVIDSTTVVLPNLALRPHDKVPFSAVLNVTRDTAATDPEAKGGLLYDFSATGTAA